MARLGRSFPHRPQLLRPIAPQLAAPTSGAGLVTLTGAATVVLKFPASGAGLLDLTAAAAAAAFPTTGSAALTLTGAANVGSGIGVTGSAFITLTALSGVGLATTGHAQLDLTALANVGLLFVFRPPRVQMQPSDPKQERLWEYYGTTQGISILKQHDGSYLQAAFPTTDDMDAAAFTYLGGHEYLIDTNEAAALAAAGYGDEIHGAPGPGGTGGGTIIGATSGYGSGAYGVGPYGA